MKCNVHVQTHHKPSSMISLIGLIIKLCRRLTAQQRSQVLETCSKPTALYMKLACDTALRWKSFTENTHNELRPTATELIIQLFERFVSLNFLIENKNICNIIINIFVILYPQSWWITCNGIYIHKRKAQGSIGSLFKTCKSDFLEDRSLYNFESVTCFNIAYFLHCHFIL